MFLGRYYGDIMFNGYSETSYSMTLPRDSDMTDAFEFPVHILNRNITLSNFSLISAHCYDISVVWVMDVLYTRKLS